MLYYTVLGDLAAEDAVSHLARRSMGSIPGNLDWENSQWRILHTWTYVVL